MSHKKRSSDRDRYEDLFLLFSQGIEKWLRRSILLLFSLLFISQLLMQIPVLRHVLVKVEQLEGEPYHHSP